MADLTGAAKTGRSKCRGSGEKIAKDQLRFGEEVPNPFADEEDAMTMHWFHVACIEPWLARISNRCPVCRAELETDQAKYLRSLRRTKTVL